MTVVDLASGKPITEALAKPNLVDALKGLVARIESGDIKVENFYLIADCGEHTYSFDNELTAAEAIVLLEREKFCILCALSGIKV
jgi:hypothetical protein